MKPIYLDNNATTPIDGEVSEFMIPFLKENFGNPSSSHIFGSQARRALGEARKKVADLISCLSSEIVFTSGGTESNNLAIRGVANARRETGNHIITSVIEHPAVMEVCRELEKDGFSVTYIGVGKDGRVSIEELEKAITPSTILVSIMHANNETGIIQPIREISGLLKSSDILFHSDAAQTAGKTQINVNDMGVDLLSLAAHKFYGPKGIGALFIREGTKINKILHGANHEKNLRPGTENLLEIAGLGEAAEIACRDLKKNMEIMRSTRDYLYDLMKNTVPGCTWNGSPDSTLPNTLSISIPGLDSSTLIAEVPEIAISAGAACHTEDITLSYVLKAMQIPDLSAMGTLRISTGKYTTRSEIEEAVKVLSEKINQLIKGVNTSPQRSEEKEVKLTHYTHGLGCACKISPGILEEILESAPKFTHPDILVGTDTSDDASVYRINDNIAIVQTVDFFTPVVDDPYEFGAITAANALSDIYAMGATPLFALNIVAFPQHRLPVSVLEKILEGGAEVAKEADLSIIGGHTIEDNEPKYGMVITGIVQPEKILRNSTAKEGDSLVLTKKLGTGILSTAVKRDLADETMRKELYQNMRILNRKTAEIIRNYNVTSCTDVTGFGLLGHLKEVCTGSGVSAVIYNSRLPLLPGVEDLAADGIIPGGTENNFKYLEPYVSYDPGIPLFRKYIAADAQTSGGLLFTISENCEKIIEDLLDSNIVASCIGKITAKGSKLISLV